MMDRYTVGVDFGTLSGRAVLVRVSDGAELATRVHSYSHGVISRALPTTGQHLPPEWALQDPQDYLDVLATAVPAVLEEANVAPEQVIGVGIDFTSCTVLPTLADGTPLSFVPEFAARPHAYVKLWKHHAAQPQADRVNAVAAARGEGWLARYGGKVSSEWTTAKGLQILEEDPGVYAASARLIEAADWVVWQLCGAETRNVSAAGHKALWQDGQYPSRDFFAALNPAFADFASKLDGPLKQLGDLAGHLTGDAARLTGLRPGTPVAVGNVDAHVSAPAVGATSVGQMVAVMGTSTCHILTDDAQREVPGMCGVVAGGVVPGAYGYEAGQSGVGDIFAWFVQNFAPPEVHAGAREAGLDLHAYLTRLAARQEIGEHGLIALDWEGGNRSILVDADLSGLIVGLTLASKPEDVYRALLEATAFGARLIVETFRASGVAVHEFIAAGGLIKNAFLMQLYADVLGLPVGVAGTEQTSALGSAMHAAVAAGAYPDIRAAASAMGRVRRGAYQPDPARHAAYDALYGEYLSLHDAFGRTRATMQTLKRLREAAHARRLEREGGRPAVSSSG